MYFAFGIFVLLNLLLVCRGEVCGNCFCNDGIAECYINNCNSVIVRDPAVEIIKIHGLLCSIHREELSDIFYYNIIIELIDSTCVDMLFNCRYVTFFYFSINYRGVIYFLLFTKFQFLQRWTHASQCYPCSHFYH